MSVQAPNGVCDIVVEDEEEAAATARRYLAYFQGDLAGWSCADQRELRFLLPEDRQRVYDVRRVLDTLADTGSVLELRAAFAPGMITALARFEGGRSACWPTTPPSSAGRSPRRTPTRRPASSTCARRTGCRCSPGRHARIHGRARLRAGGGRPARLPAVPAGGEADRPAVQRDAAQGYGLGAQAMTGGAFHSPALNVAWPTGEFGGMGLEGAVRLSMRRELEAVADPGEREKLFQDMVALAYEQGRAVNVAAHLEIDAVIDPAETREWLGRALRASPVPPLRPEGLFVDSW
nr:hypothetical protein GCM10020093_011040 [Planobispora longispora]